MPTPHKILTRDPNQAKRDRVVSALKRRGAALESNRALAERLGVDAAMVLKYRNLLGVPKLTPGSGLPQPSRKKKRRR